MSGIAPCATSGSAGMGVRTICVATARVGTWGEGARGGRRKRRRWRGRRPGRRRGRGRRTPTRPRLNCASRRCGGAFLSPAGMGGGVGLTGEVGLAIISLEAVTRCGTETSRHDSSTHTARRSALARRDSSPNLDFSIRGDAAARVRDNAGVREPTIPRSRWRCSGRAGTSIRGRGLFVHGPKKRKGILNELITVAPWSVVYICRTMAAPAGTV